MIRPLHEGRVGLFNHKVLDAASSQRLLVNVAQCGSSTSA